MEVEIGIGKSGRRAYGFDDIAIVPSRRTRDPEDVDITWELDAFRFDLPVMGSAMDGALSPRMVRVAGDTLCLTPPLIITEDQIGEIIEKVAKVIRATA